MAQTFRYEELNTADLAAGDFDKVLMPIGSCEGHGDHLPFGTDAFIAHHLALAVAEKVPRTLVLPPLWFGMSLHYRHQPMSISVSHDTNIAVYRDVLNSVIDWGFKKIVVINGHDGNVPCIGVAAQDIKLRHPDVAIAVMERWWTTALSILPKEMWDAYEGYGHGGEAETSLAMELIPALTHPDRARGMVDEKDDQIQEFWNYQELTDLGATGDGSKATREKGQRMKQVLVDYLVDFIARKERQNWVIPRRPA